MGDSPRADGVSELAAAKLAVDHVNKRGLLPGYKLHLITNDTKVCFTVLYLKGEKLNPISDGPLSVHLNPQFRFNP